jgi:hypothetical protein
MDCDITTKHLHEFLTKTLEFPNGHFNSLLDIHLKNSWDPIDYWIMMVWRLIHDYQLQPTPITTHQFDQSIYQQQLRSLMSPITTWFQTCKLINSREQSQEGVLSFVSYGASFASINLSDPGELNYCVSSHTDPCIRGHELY